MERKDSNSSEESHSDELNSSGGSDMFENKRRKNSSPSLIIPASPPRFATFEEIMKAANGVTNMVLAHEIAVDSDFKLEKIEEPPNSIYTQIKETIHQAFWDVLKSDLEETPPRFDSALKLLEETKEALLSLLMPYDKKTRQEIENALDLELIRQQVEHEALDFQAYSAFVIDTLAKLCAPIRDEQVKELRNITDIVSLFREIFQVIDVMKLDMANFTIQQMRPYIMQHSVEYEKQRFTEFLKAQAEHGVDGLLCTKEWIRRTYDQVLNGAANNVTPSLLVVESYLELLRWPDGYGYPETLMMDKSRLLDLRDRIQLLITTASVLAITYNCVGIAIHGLQHLRETLTQGILQILEHSEEENLADVLISIGEQISKDVNEALVTHGFSPLEPPAAANMKGQIGKLSDDENVIRKLIAARLYDFIKGMILTPRALTSPVKLPSGLSAVQGEVIRCTGRFLRITGHNRAVFGEYYANIIDEIMSKRSSDSFAEPSDS